MAISTQGYTYWQEKKRFQLSQDVDSHWVMYAVESGQCHYEFQNHSGIAKPHDILLVPPYCNFKRKVLSPISFHFIRIVSAKDDPYLNLLTGAHHIKDERFVDNCSILKMTNFNSSDIAQNIRTHVISDFIFLNYLEQVKLQRNELRKTKNIIVKKSISIMQNNFSLSINSIAKMVDTNPCYFSRSFKKTTGESPVVFYTKIKLRKVQEYLINTDDTLSEIAEKAGFTDAFYMSRVFSKYLNCSPISYRKNHVI